MPRYRPDVKIIARTGCPGTGKTTRISNECWDWPAPWNIVTYSNDAALALGQKGIPKELARTIYAATWAHVRPVAGLKFKGKGKAHTFRSRPVEDREDPALQEYVASAPSRQQNDPELEKLHAWSPDQGPPPDWIWDDKQVKRGRPYAVGLARWLAKGAPLSHEPYAHVAYDEAQDASRLEVCAALALVKQGGTLLVCGDEGQAIFGQSKGYADDELPAGWEWADEREYMSPGYRIGRPATEIASRVLRPYAWHSPELYSAQHGTMVHHWDGRPPESGLVMGHSRSTVGKYVDKYGLRNVKLVPGLRVDGLAVTTIHSAKGHEADSIYLLPWSKRMLDGLDAANHAVLKLGYVALTRARYHVHLTTEHYARWA